LSAINTFVPASKHPPPPDDVPPEVEPLLLPPLVELLGLVYPKLLLVVQLLHIIFLTYKVSHG
jgi:hypothetical protein